ncbi:MAG: tripartite tricarboxylate transporter substrate binding protein [Proteobacteria bacterium]|nr:tripartite tricarboxylate transporter substrate binding protein [Burkholderiales bacterium]
MCDLHRARGCPYATGVRAPARVRGRGFALGVSLGISIGGAPAQAAQHDRAAGYPSRPVRLVVPFPPGASIDFMARLLTERFGAHMGQPFLVDNRPGAGGNIGTRFAARQTPDGHTVLIGAAGSMAINSSVEQGLGFDPVRDFAPITLVGSTPLVIATHPRSGIQSLADLIAQAREKPGLLSFGSAGSGTAMHLTGELLMARAGIRLNHVPYKGSAPAAQDLLGGQIPVAITDMSSLLGPLRAGTLRGLATTAARRTLIAPSIPAVAETAGFNGFDTTGWFALFAPRATPASVIQRLHAETVKILDDPAVAARALEQAIEVQSSTSAQLGAFLLSEIAKWSRIVKASGARAY